ncbi:MAG: hypothetical protein JWO15_3640 [Sphingomonadales bacterium]|nr:hypothetical protein [Sphingomonadales bacterium]
MGEADFSGYATKAGLRCSDGRTITPEAFKHMDGIKVPLVWQHGHDVPGNVLGHAILEAREDGMYAQGFFNTTDSGQTAKQLVEHGDIKNLSIYANQLKETLVRGSKNVIHGMIREVSLVLSGANPGAVIDQVRIAHSDDPDDVTVLEDEAIIHTGLDIEAAHGDEDGSDGTDGAEGADGTDEEEPLDEETINAVVEGMTEEQQKVVHAMVGAALKHAGDDSGETVQDVFDGFTDQQKQVVYYMIGVALEDAASNTDAAHADTNNEDALTHQEGNASMARNVFDQNGQTTKQGPVLSHSDIESIFALAKEPGQTFKSALKHVAENSDELKHSIENLELLFPDAKSVNPDDPQFITRRMEWVQVVLDGTKHSPFAKVKTILADITGEEARAKGYVKGNLKTEEVLGLLRRTTSPATIYKKQKLDRDDILDITDIDIVMWLKAEMRIMIEEEVARAILVGDGRSNLSPDKIKDPAGAVDGVGIRSILHDSDLYAVKATLDANVSAKDAVKGLVRARSKYRGTGKPTLFISDAFLTDIMLEEDKFGRALYETEQALQDKLRVGAIVTIDLFEEYEDLFAIMVSLADYTIGANRGGELTSFDDFDIDYNQYKYLQETRLSGGLTKPFSAVVVSRSQGTLATVVAPSFDGTTNTITIPTATGVDYLINDEVVTGDRVITEPTEVEAAADEGYYLAPNSTRTWSYTP